MLYLAELVNAENGVVRCRDEIVPVSSADLSCVPQLPNLVDEVIQLLNMPPAIFTSTTAAAAVTRSSVESLAEPRINQLQSRWLGTAAE